MDSMDDPIDIGYHEEITVTSTPLISDTLKGFIIGVIASFIGSYLYSKFGR